LPLCIGEVNGKTVLVGNKALMNTNDIDVPTETDSIVESIVLMAIDNNFAGYVVIADELKEDAKQTITELQKSKMLKVDYYQKIN